MSDNSQTTPFISNKEIFEWLTTALLRGSSLDEKLEEYGPRFWEGCCERLELLRSRLENIEAVYKLDMSRGEVEIYKAMIRAALK